MCILVIIVGKLWSHAAFIFPPQWCCVPVTIVIYSRQTYLFYIGYVNICSNIFCFEINVEQFNLRGNFMQPRLAFFLKAILFVFLWDLPVASCDSILGGLGIFHVRVQSMA